ncbi:MAG: ATP-binding protein [Gammaproteobacteria bacterium]|nr:ATP-binding protein [Gammaproteobacteria bacterium]
MKFFRPKSILRLILIGFVLVALPLIIALVVATVSVDRLVTQSQHALFQSVQVATGTQVLLESLTAMERNARQYQVLGDAVLLDVYKENRTRFVDTARSLKAMDLAGNQRNLLHQLFSAEREVHLVFSSPPHNDPDAIPAVQKYTELAQTAQQILEDNQALINRGLEQIQSVAQEVQHTLIMEAVALIPIAILLMVIFTVLITRPINQIDRAIRRLGDGTFNSPVVITGPRDLEQLGERLNWLQDRLLELEQEKTKFLQHISHELKTPLTTIREGAELMDEQIVGSLNSQQREIAHILHENSIQLQKLIEDLLDFSILQSHQSRTLHAGVELDALIEEVLEDHKVALLSRQLELSKSLEAVSLVGDREKLRTLVDNLVSNAVKYSPLGSRLSVSLSTRDSQAVIEVADSGPGIPWAERERVFEAFFQGEPAARGHVRGSGLGLSIAREHAQAHGGDISVVECEASGACLRVVLPLEQVT